MDKDIELLEQFAGESEKNKKNAERITKYVKPYSDRDVIEYTEDDILDIIINKRKLYNVRTVDNMLRDLSHFYHWCEMTGKIEHNFVENSIKLQKFNIEIEMLSAGNVKLYTREYIKSKVKGLFNQDYLEALLLLTFNGIRNADLSKIDYADIDFKNKKIKGFDITLDDATIESINNMMKLEYWDTEHQSYPFVNNGKLFRPTESNNKNKNNLVQAKLKEIDLKSDIVYSSGVIIRLIEKIGLKEFYDYMLDFEQFEKRNQKRKKDNRHEENTGIVTQKMILDDFQWNLDHIGYGKKATEFKYSYKVYAIGLRKGVFHL